MIYFDSAATTLQKPTSVSRAVAYAVDHMASPGRGGHQASMLAADTTFACREALAELFHMSDSSHVVFTFNATHALNIAIKSLVKSGDTVLVSGYEHNAVIRPLHGIEGVSVKVARSQLYDVEDTIRTFQVEMTPDVSCVICNHVSNVFGYIMPIDEIAVLCKQKGIPLIVDCSQSAGILDIDPNKWGASFVAMPGHKGLYGPQGTGVLLCSSHSKTLLEGGTGSMSMGAEMPQFLPDRLEAGTHNVAGIAGLLEGVRFVKKLGLDTIRNHEAMLLTQMVSGLTSMKNITCYYDKTYHNQLGVLSFALHEADCEFVGERLGALNVAVRAGLHCAPVAHQTAGTLERGTVRVSFSAFNKSVEVREFLKKLDQL